MRRLPGASWLSRRELTEPPPTDVHRMQSCSRALPAAQPTHHNQQSTMQTCTHAQTDRQPPHIVPLTYELPMGAFARAGKTLGVFFKKRCLGC